MTRCCGCGMRRRRPRRRTRRCSATSSTRSSTPCTTRAATCVVHLAEEQMGDGGGDLCLENKVYFDLVP
eukprot:4542898-Prymnesium_polylepis.1